MDNGELAGLGRWPIQMLAMRLTGGTIDTEQAERKFVGASRHPLVPDGRVWQQAKVESRGVPSRHVRRVLLRGQDVCAEATNPQIAPSIRGVAASGQAGVHPSR